MIENEQIEEALEKLWECLEEQSGPDVVTESYLNKALGVSIQSLIQKGLIQKSKEKLLFTTAGRNAAEQTIRRHRLSCRAIPFSWIAFFHRLFFQWGTANMLLIPIWLK